MTYENFYNIATYLNECNNNTFSNKDVACYAYDYKVEYEKSILNNIPTFTMTSLILLLVEDMDKGDYIECDNTITIEVMNKVLEETLENL